MLFTQCGQIIMALTNSFNLINTILTPPKFRLYVERKWFIETIFITMNNLWYQRITSITLVSRGQIAFSQHGTYQLEL